MTDRRLDPDELWRTTRLGREEYVQKLLATLIVGAPHSGWNVRREPSERGRRFIDRLHGQSFSETPPQAPVFIDEYELPSRHDGEHAGWPDHAVQWPGRLFMIELTTERRSHRQSQLPHYLDLARHHHPDDQIDLLYLTPAMEVGPPSAIPAGAEYRHVSWSEVQPLIADVWGTSAVGWERIMADSLAWWLEEVEAGRPLPPREAPEPAPSPDAPPADSDSRRGGDRPAPVGFRATGW